ncbi:RDD family protein [Pontibacter arcticus]|uniref:RDD family protein n=1 Tax=Pontibacter arcticus TaxID=2080288 RepID=A0A364RDK9_9BACT|nr:RDD family protein [Pontibacter arcticus]RAU82347.1 RDD family protein [Pontibacter arcticus]
MIPENSNPLTHPYAQIWARFIAMLLDSILMALVTLVIMLLLGMKMPNMDDPETRLQLNLTSMVLGWVYYSFMESSTYQATFGKQVMGLFVTDMQGQRLSFGKASARYFGRLLSGLTFLVGYLVAFFTAKKQSLHDLLAGTLVFKH